MALNDNRHAHFEYLAHAIRRGWMGGGFNIWALDVARDLQGRGLLTAEEVRQLEKLTGHRQTHLNEAA